MLYLKGSANTEKNYLPHLQRFTDFTEKTPTELIENAEYELDKTMKKEKEEL